jgi:hypothetical protein
MTIYIAPDCPREVERLIREKHRGERIYGRSLFPPATQRELAARRAAFPIKPKADQRPCDVGLFSDEATQLDLVDLSRATERK